MFGFLKDPDRRAILSWLGGGTVVVAGGIWTVVTFVVDHKKSPEKQSGPKVELSGQGITSGGNISVGRDLTVTNGPNKEQIDQLQKPYVEQLSAKDAQIAALIKQNGDLIQNLLKNDPAAGPATRQAVTQAVESIAQGAAEGDARLRQALDLLKANKVAEASQLLSAFASDKSAQAEQATAQAEKDRKDAVAAYRNLGAIAGLRDPKRALEAYERALTLDPDDMDSLLWVGFIQIDHGDLGEAQTRLERALTLARSSDQKLYKSSALTGIGGIRQKKGDLAGALQSYNDSVAISDRLAKSDPGNALWQVGLSVSYEKIGDVRVAQGDLAGALKSYNDGHAIFDRFAKSTPATPFGRAVSRVSYEKIGDVQLAQGDARRRAEILQRWSRHLRPAGEIGSRQRPLAARLSRRRSPGSATCRSAQGDLAGALKSYNDGLAIITRLAKTDPGNADWQRGFSVSFNKVGDVQVAQGDLAGALKSYNDGHAIFDRLAKSDPGNDDWQHDLSASFNRVGDVHTRAGQPRRRAEIL